MLVLLWANEILQTSQNPDIPIPLGSDVNISVQTFSMHDSSYQGVNTQQH